MRYLLPTISLLLIGTGLIVAKPPRGTTIYPCPVVTQTVYQTEIRYVERVVTQKVETLVYTNAPSAPTVIGDYDGVIWDRSGGMTFPIYFKEGR